MAVQGGWVGQKRSKSMYVICGRPLVSVNYQWNHSQPYRILLLFCFMIDLCQAQVSTTQMIFMLFESVKRDL